MEEDEIESWYDDQKQAIAKVYQKQLAEARGRKDIDVNTMMQKVIAIENKFHAQFKKLHNEYEKKLIGNQNAKIKKELRKTRIHKALAPARFITNMISTAAEHIGGTIRLRKKQIHKWWIEKGKMKVYRPIYQAWDRYLMAWHWFWARAVWHVMPPYRFFARPIQKTIHKIIAAAITLVHKTIDISKKALAGSIKVSKAAATKASAWGKTAGGFVSERIKSAKEGIKAAKEKIRSIGKKEEGEKPAAS